MPLPDEEISRLEHRLDSLVRTQIDFQKEVSAIRVELIRLQNPEAEIRADRATVPPDQPYASPEPEPPTEAPSPTQPRPTPQPPRQSVNIPSPTFGHTYSSQSEREPGRFGQTFNAYVESARADVEKFIGENLISKIGIIVLVLGVGIGAKYAIDNNLISPLTRIIIGYAFGFGLVGLAIKLKPKYLNFSAVLISGGMAIMYFITFFAYSAYELIPQLSAFALMVMFTAFTVGAAFAYDRQVIAHIGLVGAYAVPFLLSSDSGNYLALFSYMAIVNLGILAISIKKNWTPILYTAFVFTWAIFYGWFVSKYDEGSHLYLALAFVAIFFASFLATQIAQRVFHEDVDKNANLISALFNGLVFYLLCFGIGNTVSGEVHTWVFFVFLAVATTAVLFVTFRHYKQYFLYLAFPLVWLTFGVWYADKYNAAEYFTLAVAASAAFFSVFYFTTLFHRLVSGTFGFIESTGAVHSNAFIFYGFGYSVLDANASTSGFLGLFTAAHSGLHLGVAHAVNRYKNDAVDVVQVLTILILTFATIAVPVQLDGNFVTLVWTCEAALLFWYGRMNRVELFEYIAYPIMALASASMFMDWVSAYGERTNYPSEFNRLPLVNGDMVTAAVFVIAFAFIWYVNREESHDPVLDADLRAPIGWTVGAAAIFVLFNALRIEIDNSHHLRFGDLNSAAVGDVSLSVHGLAMLNAGWQLIYTMAFVTAMGAINMIKGRSRSVAFVCVALSMIVLFVLCTFGMLVFSDLRTNYFSSASEPGDGVGWVAIGIRYVGYLAATTLLFVLYRTSQDDELTDIFSPEVRDISFEAVAYGSVFILASCELVNLMGQMSIPDATKLGLSILWGVYALILVIFGIAKAKKHLRISAFVLLGVTLVKLFVYDIADLDTIPKTILFVTLGITLLAVSFLYNKYKNLIQGTSPPASEENI
ncbi:MAG: DUF2339 domain-containing protein [Pyrinomonadaceae bacterium]